MTITTFYKPDTQELNFLIVYDTFIQNLSSTADFLQKVSGNTEDTGKSGRDTSLGSSTSVSDGGVSGSAVLANNSSAVLVHVTTSADSNDSAQSA